jgi:hypothetical protein
MTGPDETAGRGHLRTASADREHVVAALKTAFVQGRLTKEELEARVAGAFASRTYAELATLTADIPAGPAATRPAAARPAASPARTMAKAAGRTGICMLAAVALAEAAVLGGNPLLLVAAAFAVIAASGFLGYGIIDAWHEMRARRLPPQRRGQGHQGHQGHQGPEGGRSGLPASPGGREDPTRADLRARQPERNRRYSALLSYGS